MKRTLNQRANGAYVPTTVTHSPTARDLAVRRANATELAQVFSVVGAGDVVRAEVVFPHSASVAAFASSYDAEKWLCASDWKNDYEVIL